MVKFRCSKPTKETGKILERSIPEVAKLREFSTESCRCMALVASNYWFDLERKSKDWSPHKIC